MKQVTELDVPQPLDMYPVETPEPFPKAKTKNSKTKQEKKKKPAKKSLCFSTSQLEAIASMI